MAVTDDELADLLLQLDAGRQSWIDGKLGFGDAMDVDQDDDMSIFGPFGGLLRGTSELAGRQQRAAHLFEGGEGSCEVVKTIIGATSSPSYRSNATSPVCAAANRRRPGCFAPPRSSSGGTVAGSVCIAMPIP